MAHMRRRWLRFWSPPRRRPTCSFPTRRRASTSAAFDGFAYYTEQPDGFRVVATLAEGEAGSPVRFEATLADSQTLTISVPRELGKSALSVEFARNGDRVFVDHQPRPGVL